MRRATRAVIAFVAMSIGIVCSGDLFAADGACKRIVSIAPSVTEVLYELGLGDKIVGVTRYDVFPPAVKEKQKIGGFFDTNVEAVFKLRPSLVLTLVEGQEVAQQLETLGLRVVAVEHRSVSGILESIAKIGELCGRTRESSDLLTRLKTRIERVRNAARGGESLRVLVVLSGQGDGALLQGAYISGKDGFYSDLLRVLGAENAYTGTTLSVPLLTAEGLGSLRVDHLIEISPSPLTSDEKRLRVAAWQGLVKGRSAIRSITVIDESYASIPGPRFVHLLEDFARVLRGSDIDLSPANGKSS